LPMKSLWLISLATLMLWGCVSIKPGGLTRDKAAPDLPGTAITRYRAPESSQLYKATLDIKKHHLTGLLVIKRMDTVAPQGAQKKPEDSPGTFRIVFVNEVGMTFFDLELSPDSLHVVSCFASLNRKALINILETDFRILTMNDPMQDQKHYRKDGTNQCVVTGKTGRYKVWQTWSPGNDTLMYVGAKSTIADPVRILFDNYKDGTPGKITIENPFIGLKWSLRRLVQ
jgi:hypothetical protein